MSPQWTSWKQRKICQLCFSAVLVITSLETLVRGLLLTENLKWFAWIVSKLSCIMWDGVLIKFWWPKGQGGKLLWTSRLLMSYLIPVFLRQELRKMSAYCEINIHLLEWVECAVYVLVNRATICIIVWNKRNKWIKSAKSSHFGTSRGPLSYIVAWTL